MVIAKKIAIRLLLIAIFLFCLFTVILYSRGYRFNIYTKKIDGSGILVASSNPDGAKIYINGKFQGATNSNIMLPPGSYVVEIKKEGYTSWSKQIDIKKEIVIKIDPQLFPLNPSLSPLTSLGVKKAFLSKSAQKIIFITQNNDPNKDGFYLLEVSKHPLYIINPLRRIALLSSFPKTCTFENTSVVFSPDEKQILLTIQCDTKYSKEITYLMPTDKESTELFDVTNSQTILKNSWKTENDNTLQKILETYKKPFNSIAQNYFDIIAFSPDETKILYIAKKNINIPPIIKNRPPSSNQTPESRYINSGSLYIYDKKEDKNFLILTKNQIISQKLTKSNFLWFSDSQRIVIQEQNHFSITDYDGTNKKVVYSGPFEKGFFAISDNGKLIVLINLNPKNNPYPDFYTIGLR